MHLAMSTQKWYRFGILCWLVAFVVTKFPREQTLVHKCHKRTSQLRTAPKCWLAAQFCEFGPINFSDWQISVGLTNKWGTFCQFPNKMPCEGHVPCVVYFDWWMGATNAVRWYKSTFSILSLSFTSKARKKGKKWFSGLHQCLPPRWSTGWISLPSSPLNKGC